MTRSLIVGAGRSALGAAKLLLASDSTHGKSSEVTVTDIEEKYPEQLAEIRKAGAKVIIGPQTVKLLEDVDQIIVSPGLSPKIPLLEAARLRNLPILSEIDIALQVFQGKIIGVTGTNGKSTTTLLVDHFFQSLGVKSAASGNIGIPPSLLIADKQSPDIFVLELSSYQLDYSKAIQNQVSLFMSFAPDHLERHGTMQAYFEAKWKLALNTEASGLIIMPKKVAQFAKDFGVAMPKARICQILVDDESLVDLPHSIAVCIRGNQLLTPSASVDFPANLEFHNKINSAAALLAVMHMIPSALPTSLMASLASFPWLPFRYQKIGTIRGEAIYNDSKSTNVESTVIALQSTEMPCILMLGGFSKGESFTPILEFRSKIKILIAFGAARQRIAEDLQILCPIVFDSLQKALENIESLLTQHQGPLVFSPANASFDEFKNFEDRGAFFNLKMKPLLDR